MSKVYNWYARKPSFPGTFGFFIFHFFFLLIIIIFHLQPKSTLMIKTKTDIGNKSTSNTCF